MSQKLFLVILSKIIISNNDQEISHIIYDKGAPY